jgi:hypothetical protein
MPLPRTCSPICRWQDVAVPECELRWSSPYPGLVYDHDPADVAIVGWEEFTLQQWESIFFAYRSWAGLRTLGRRWSDLLEVTLGCSQDVADKLVNAVVINGPVRSVDGAGDAADIVDGMTKVLARIPDALGDMAGLEPELTAMLLERHARLLTFIQAQAPGTDDC